MPYIKKLTFALPFLICWYWFLTEIAFFLGDYMVIFTLSTSVLVRLLVTCLSLLAAGLFLMITLTLAGGWVYVLLIVGSASILPFTLLPLPTSIALAIGTSLASISVMLLLNRSLATYVTFNPATLLGPPVKRWVILILIIVSFLFWLRANQTITTNGFTIPDSLLDQTLALIPRAAPLSSISPEQMELLRQNPETLKQFGLDPSILDSLPASLEQPMQAGETIKQVAADQLERLIAPYLSWVSPVLAFLFFLTLHSVVSILAIALSPLLLFLFWVMDKTNFTSYTVETRQVRKLVV